MTKKRVLLKPRASQQGVFNPTICENYIFYRVEDNNGISLINRAEYSIQKGKVKIIPKTAETILTSEYDYETKGCEDPRAVRIGNKFFMTYVGMAEKGSLCLAESNDLINWEKKGIILKPAETGWDSSMVKGGTIFPHKINGYYYMFYLGEIKPWHASIGVARSKNLYEWERFLDKPVLTSRRGHFDSQGLEPCTTFYDKSKNIGVLVYAGWEEKLVHKGGVATFSMTSPTEIIYRRDTPFIEPTEEWEINGNFPNVVFPTGVIKQPERIYVLWGAADKVIGERPYTLEEILGGKVK